MVEQVVVAPPVSVNDHSTVLVTITFPCDRSFTYKRHVWSYSQANLVEYRQVLSNVDWDSCFQSEDINKIYENWSKNLCFQLFCVFQTDICDLMGQNQSHVAIFSYGVKYTSF